MLPALLTTGLAMFQFTTSGWLQTSVLPAACAGLIFAGLFGCASPWSIEGGNGNSQATASREQAFTRQRDSMVRDQLESRDIRDRRVLEAMRKVPRHRFVPANMVSSAYDDSALPIGLGQTISQPYIVAYMTQALRLRGSEKILEIGTGSGYQAAVLSELSAEVYSVEIVSELASKAKALLETLGYKNIHTRTGDGYLGWPEYAPFDGIMVTAAPDHVPQPLVDQLKPGGRMIIPVGRGDQELILIEKTEEGISRRSTIPVRFVPMTGKALDRQPR